MTNCENSVYDKNSMTDNVAFSYVTMAEADVVKCIKLLTYGKAPGVDGLAAEHYIHGHGSSQHQPHPAQFGFATDRGTDMAIALAHDVSERFNRRGSPVFT